MQVVHEAALRADVHKKTVVACVLVTQPSDKVDKEVRTFSTMTGDDLLLLSDWLDSLGWAVVMESTVLEAGVQHSGGRPRGHARQRRAHQGGTGQEDRCEGFRVDSGPAAARAVEVEHHPAGSHPRAEGVDPVPQELDRGAGVEANRLHKVLETANIKLDGGDGRVGDFGQADARGDTARGTISRCLRVRDG